MSTQHLFTLLLLVFTVSSGCNLMERQQSPNIAETPPYWQPKSEMAHSQLAGMRAFHEKESAKMSEDMHAARNREIERLEAVSKELEKDKRGKESYEKTLERREKWAGWFKMKDKNNKKDTALPMVSRIGSTHKNTQ